MQDDDDWGLDSLNSSDMEDWNSSYYASMDDVKELDIDLELENEPIVVKTTIGKLSSGRIVLAVFTGLVYSLILCFIICSIYLNKISYPPKMESNYEETRLYSLESYGSYLTSDSLSGYLGDELKYANGNINKEAFVKKVIGSVVYTPNTVNSKNVYGNDLIDRKTREVVTESSPLDEGEAVTLTYIDYGSIGIDEVAVQALVNANGLVYSDVDYSNKLEDLFCQYIITLDSLPTVSVSHVPTFNKEEVGYSVSQDEDIFLDRLLFSSSSLYGLFNRFSESVWVCSGGDLCTLTISEEWLAWDSSVEEIKATASEPNKYDTRFSLDFDWCGAYHLQNELEVAINPEIGDGSKENPAGIGTSVVTNVFVQETIKKKKKEELVTNSYPISVRMIEYGVSEDAISWFESKDTRNRGIDISSEVQYCYYKFEVTNLSDKELTINDNSCICDSGENTIDRSGIVYGLTESVTLKPYESGIIESWNKSTELNKKYVIWGKDFNRQSSSVWFRVLAGDIDDESEEKGVTINNSRDSSN